MQHSNHFSIKESEYYGMQMHQWLKENWDKTYEIIEILKIKNKDEDFLLTSALRLERLKKRALQEFPNAMAFIRPGLDE